MGQFLTALNKKMKSEIGIGTIEIILILVVLIALVLVFKDEILDLADSIFTQINSSAKKVY